MICIQCKNETNNPKFCNRSCAATYNNSKYPKRVKKNSLENCMYCGKKLIWSQKKYCSVKHQKEYVLKEFIQDWLDNKVTGLSSLGTLNHSLKRYLISIRGDKCEICGWAERNITTGKIPIVADHIDGNWKNNRPENIKLLCPNCDSLQPTYKALNKGKGRAWRRSS